MNRKRFMLGPVLVSVLVAGLLFGGNVQSASPASPIKSKVFKAQLAWELGQAKRPQWAQHLSSGVMYNLLLASGVFEARVAQAERTGVRVPTIGSTNTIGCAHTFTGGIGQANVRMNQDCGLRRQAEETIAVNPTNRNNLIAGQNDSRLGFNQCGFDFSFDGGVHWGDMNPPFHQILLGNGHNLDFCSDPTVAFDTQGNAFAGGLGLSIDGLDSSILVARSDAPIGGAFYHNPDQSDPFHQYEDVPLGIVIDEFDENGCLANDKELMTADATLGSPKADNLYMVWTRFDFCTGEGVGAHSPIYFSQSTNGGADWSAVIEISGSNKKFCTAFSGESDPNACDQDQGGHPVVGADGTLYVGFGNGNTPVFGVNQHMMVKCPPTEDCSDPGSWQGPYKISDDIGTQPVASITDPVTGCPAGRQCLPPNGYRMDDFVQGSISVDDSGRLYFVWNDFRNGDTTPSCNTGDYGTSDPPCNNDVFYSYSVDGGVTWQGPYQVSPPDPDLTAQWQPWGAVAPLGNILWVAYYDRSYGNCEFEGCNDITLAKIDHPRSSKIITYRRLTTASMPNLVVANNPIQAGFLGDYMWVAVNAGRPYVVWADTRGQGRAGIVEEDVYFAQ